MTQTVNILPAMQETQVGSWIGMIPWRRKWLPTLVFLPGEFHGQRNLVSYNTWGHRESDISMGSQRVRYSKEMPRVPLVAQIVKNMPST